MERVVDTFGSSKMVIGNIVESMTVRQSFVALGKLKAVEINLATYCRVNTCKLWVKVTDRQGREFGSKEIPCRILKDNQFYRIQFDLSLTPHNHYELWLVSDGTASNSVTAKWGTPKHPQTSFFVGSTRFEGELFCRMEFETTHSRLSDSVDVASRSNLGFMREFLNEQNRKVSIIILTKDKPEMLQKCLSRIQEHVKYESYEVVIGDTGSSDPGVDEVYRDLPPNCKVIRGLDYHFSKANNYLAREHATGSFLLFMNNDVYLERDSVSDVVKALRAYPIGTVGVRLVRENGMIDHDGQTLFRDGSIREPAHESDGKKAQNVPEVDVFVEGNTAAFMMTRRGVFEAVGGFDEDYEDIYQDCDFALKVIGLGFKHLCLRSAPAVHLGSLTRGKGGNEVDLERYLNRWAGFYFLGCFSPFFSFITCCSNADIYLQMFRTLPPGGGTIELLPVQNRDNFFTVTEALNLGQRLSSGKYSVFCHQDVLYNEAWFKDVVKSLKALEERSVGVIGFEGVRVQDEKRAVKGWRQLGQPGYMEVQTVDEYCLIAEKGQFWFDEQFRFHFYGVDICLQALKRGLMNYVIYGRSEHVSGGDQNIKDDPEAFRSEVRNLWKKWGEAHTHIATTTVSLTSEGLKYYLCRDVLGEEESCLSSST